jgi:superfamily II DNA/RNA helicase
MTTFESLGVAPDLADALRQRGIEAPFPIQELTIPDALAGRDVCGKAKTGSGKTLAFGLPLLERLRAGESTRPRGLVLVPTRELANQVREELEPLAAAVGCSIEAVYGGARMQQQIAELEKGVDVIVATPGRLIDLIGRGDAKLDDIEAVVIDEADRMADMGFLPQVEWVLRHVPGRHQTLLFSATLDGVVDGLIKRYQHDPVMHEIESKLVSIEEMTHRILLVHEMDKVKVAAAIARNTQRTIMFVNTKRAADRVTRALIDEGIKARAIHGDLRQRDRERTLADFSGGKLPVLVATDVAARGIHVDDVEVVIHVDPPDDHKTYLHRSGRTARAGGSGLVVTLLIWNQELQVKRLIRRLGIGQPIVEMFSNDPRLDDLAGWNPASDGIVA